MMKPDRFKAISNNYGELFSEVFKAQGLDYSEFQQSVSDEVSKVEGYYSMPILDIGVGDGETSKGLIDIGCDDLTGIDLNPQMLAQCEKRFGKKIKLVQGDATDLSVFNHNQFPIIVTAATIHNISKNERQKFWSEIRRLQPKLFILAEKIVDPDQRKQSLAYNEEIGAINFIYRENHKMPEVAAEWVRHYEEDDREKLLIDEVKENLGEKYTTKIIFEMGLYKTIRCDLR